jgi:septal ring factor EnvC (AmiA/AmiB activator)
MMRWRVVASVSAMLLVAMSLRGSAAGAPADRQLETVRSEIRKLEVRLADLTAREADVRAEKERLQTELGLAEARVRENELVLAASLEEITRLRTQSDAMGEELRRRRSELRRHLEMAALLGRPGALQLMVDAARGGQLDQALGVVSVLTEGQLRLVEEYDDLRRRRAARLAELSQEVEQARTIEAELVDRRSAVDELREKVDTTLREVARDRQRTDSRLTEMRQRAEALENLMGRLAATDRLTGAEDVRKFKGALPWPASGVTVRTFGRHYLPKYSTYTVCNGLRLNVESGLEVKAVFPGMVAFARHFKGYGNMVVLDHGHGVYSLVAGLATIHVRLNQRVTMGTRLGLAAPPTDDGNLYFEVRVGDEPQDPRRWLQLKEGKAR